MDDIKEAVNGSCQQGLNPDIFAENEGKSPALSPEGVQQGNSVPQNAGKQESTAHINNAPKSKNIKKDRHLSARERKAVALLVSGMSQKDALISAGYSESVATTQAHDVLGKPLVIRALDKAFIDAGIDVTRLAKKHNELLDCQKVISAMVINDRDADSQTNDFIEVPDGQVQVKALELAYKVRGDFAPELHAVVTESYGDRIRRIRAENP